MKKIIIIATLIWLYPILLSAETFLLQTVEENPVVYQIDIEWDSECGGYKITNSELVSQVGIGASANDLLNQYGFPDEIGVSNSTLGAPTIPFDIDDDEQIDFYLPTTTNMSGITINPTIVPNYYYYIYDDLGLIFVIHNNLIVDIETI